MKHFWRSLFSIIVSLAITGVALADAEKSGIVERVGGDYRVARIDKLDDGTFLIEFKSLHPSGKFDVIRLNSDHVHVAVKSGDRLRLSAEVLRITGAVAEASQVLLFLKSSRGRTPVWLLSNRYKPRDLTGSSYLEMHVPLNDYMIL